MHSRLTRLLRLGRASVAGRSVAAALILTVQVGCAWLGASEPLPEPLSQDRAILTHEFGQDESALRNLQNEIAKAAPEEYAAYEERLLSMMTSEEATYGCRQFCARMLRLIGSDRAVPYLEEMMGDEDDRTAYVARYALESIPGEAATAALRRQLRKSEGDRLVGAISSLGNRRYSQSIDRLGRLATNEDPLVARAAIHALRQIGGQTALQTLVKAKIAPELMFDRLEAVAELATSVPDTEAVRVANEYLLRAVQDDQLPAPLRIAALNSAADAAPQLAAVAAESLLADADPQVASAGLRQLAAIRVAENRSWLDAAKQLPPDLQVQALGLVDRGQNEAVEASLADFLASDDAQVRIAAIQAVGRIGTPRAGSMLGDRMEALLTADNATQSATREAFTRISAPEFNTYLIAQVTRQSNPYVRLQLVEVLAARRAEGALPVVLSLTDDDNRASRARMAAIGELATSADLSC